MALNFERREEWENITAQHKKEMTTTMNCSTSANGVWFGLFAPSSPCNGHGVCVPFYPTNTTGVCICEEFWDGAADVFDLRVGTDPVTGKVVALDCSNNVIASLCLWSLLLLGCLIHQFHSTRALITVFRTHGLKPKTSKGCMLYAPYQFLCLDALIANPLLLTLAILKITRNGVIGTDFAVTVCLAAGVQLWNVAWALFQIHQFHVLVSSNLQQRGDQLCRKYNKLVMVMSASYFFLSLLPTLVALSLDKSVGPIANGEYIILIVRNLGVVFWNLSQIYTSYVLKNELKALSSSSGTVSNGVQNIMSFFDAERKHLRARNLISLLLYPLFSLPWFWPSQFFQIAFMIFLGGLTMSPGKVILQSHKLAKSAAGKHTGTVVATTFSSSRDQT